MFQQSLTFNEFHISGYTAGKTHVIPILYLTLPGIDPNDFRKTTITLEFLTTFALLVPIVDCSKAGQYYDDLTDDEKIVCDQTAEFEEFVLQYLDKAFMLIDSSSQEIIRMESDTENLRSKLESIAESVLQSSCHGILGQCSTVRILCFLLVFGGARFSFRYVDVIDTIDF